MSDHEAPARRRRAGSWTAARSASSCSAGTVTRGSVASHRSGSPRPEWQQANRAPVGYSSDSPAGVGDVFRNEALHAVGVDPRQSCRSLDADLLARLWDVLRPTMTEQAL